MFEAHVLSCATVPRILYIFPASFWDRKAAVTVTSRGLLRFVYITGNHNCQHPEGILSFIRCVIHNFWAPEESNKMTMLITPYGETVCFSVKPIGRVFTYTVSMDRNSYILVVGLCSFAACYRHGPLADEWSRGLLMWTLRFLSLVLVYTGVAVPLFAYAVMVLLLFSWSLRYPLRAFSYLRWWVSFL
ncbi:nuclear envelope integral membrane protein 2 [Cricetulus griseus]